MAQRYTVTLEISGDKLPKVLEMRLPQLPAETQVEVKEFRRKE